MANEVHAKHPDYSVAKVFRKAAQRTRRILGIKEGIVAPEGSDEEGKETPAFPHVKGHRERGGGEKPTKLEQEISDLID